MKRNKLTFISGACALIMLAVVCATTALAADEVTVTGTVYAMSWDDDDNVTAATITTGTGEEYIIVADTVGKELFQLDLTAVKASGVIGEDSEGNKTLTVTKYEVMPE